MRRGGRSPSTWQRAPASRSGKSSVEQSSGRSDGNCGGAARSRRLCERRRDATSRRGRSTLRLARAGIGRAPRAEAIATLERLAVVDDERVAVAQAAALAERGYGDDAIRWKLAVAGLEPEQAEHAVQLLEPESERARRLVERRGRSPATSRFLARRGFAGDVVEAVVAADDASA